MNYEIIWRGHSFGYLTDGPPSDGDTYLPRIAGGYPAALVYCAFPGGWFAETEEAARILEAALASPDS